MAIQDAEHELGRGLRLLAWWGALADAQTSLTETALTRLSDTASRIEAAGVAQAEALAALGGELTPLAVAAAQARDPAAALDAQLKIAASVRRCGTACLQAWADVALGMSAPKADAAPER